MQHPFPPSTNTNKKYSSKPSHTSINEEPAPDTATSTATTARAPSASVRVPPGIARPLLCGGASPLGSPPSSRPLDATGA
eukprot:355463-Chlamydomonas_euryale.AAC.3